MIAPEGGVPPDHEVAANGFHELIFIHVGRIGKKSLADTAEHLGIVGEFVVGLEVFDHDRRPYTLDAAGVSELARMSQSIAYRLPENRSVNSILCCQISSLWVSWVEAINGGKPHTA